MDPQKNCLQKAFPSLTGGSIRTDRLGELFHVVENHTLLLSMHPATLCTERPDRKPYLMKSLGAGNSAPEFSNEFWTILLKWREYGDRIMIICHNRYQALVEKLTENQIFPIPPIRLYRPSSPRHIFSS